MRASEAPEQWRLVLKAVKRDDYKLAHKLAVKYGFTENSVKGRGVEVRHEIIKGYYVAMSPHGGVYSHKSASALSRYLELSPTYISNVLSRTDKPIPRGKMKGWLFWRE